MMTGFFNRTNALNVNLSRSYKRKNGPVIQFEQISEEV